MRKIFVLDTNVILRDPLCFFKFQDNDVHLPITVIEELDKFKKGYSDVSQNARLAIRKLDELRQKGDLTKGVQIAEGLGKLYVEDGELLESYSEINDNKILNFTKNLKKKYKRTPVILVSKDLNMRIKANVLGITAEDYKNDKLPESEINLFPDNHLEVDNDTIVNLYQNNQVETDLELPENSYWVLTVDGMNAIPVKYRNYTFYRVKENLVVQGIKAKNYEQSFLYDALLDDEIKAVFVIGKAGVGKTQLVTAVMLEYLNSNKYKKFLVTKPMIPLDGNRYNEIGFLPGDMIEKIFPWFGAIFDNLSNIISNNAEELVYQGFIELLPLTYLRGRSLKNVFLFADEAQGMTPSEMKTLISRIADGSKIVCCGDIYQIDNPYLSQFDNGLTLAANKLYGQPGVAVIYMSECQRSYVASLAEKL